ncbi:hypothetical protein [Saccharicrinis carchari]|nr:hypothetical protein [Saccharicrinis carchari]
MIRSISYPDDNLADRPVEETLKDQVVFESTFNKTAPAQGNVDD